MTELADNVRTAREASELTQQDLAVAAGLCVRTIQNLEKGQWPSSQTLDAVARALGKTNAQLLGQKEASKS